MLILILLFSLVLVTSVFIGMTIAERGAFTALAEPTSDYQLKDELLNDSELALFINLQKYLGDKFIVLSKVRIEDFVKVPEKDLDYGERQGMRGRIKSRHVDFLICDRADTKPLLAIELDGHSHFGAKSQARDEFVNELYKSIGLPIEHIPVGANFEKEALRLKNILTSSDKH
jgi:hypothetical protein